MKKCIICCICLTTVFAKAQNIKAFNFMLGHWEMKTANGKNTEHWLAKGDSLLGRSYKHTQGDSLLTESVVLKKKNKVWYLRVTGFEKENEGQTDFKLIYSRGGLYVFENKTHDFPQRIVYQNKGGNQLFAWIEGNIKGKNKKIPFRYSKY